MANILKVTTPPQTTYNNTPVKGNQHVAPPSNIKNPIDLDRVTRQDERGAQQGLNRQAMHYTSNYNKFLENVKNSVPTADIMREIFGSGLEGLINSSATAPSMAQELREFTEMMQLGENDLHAFAKTQIESATGFKSALFDILRELMNDTYSVDFKADILKFAKRFNDMASNQRILGEIFQNLQELSELIPKSDGITLAQMADALNLESPNGDTSMNLQLLKNEILPLLSKYISRTNDLGKVRDLMSLLSLNISRYESGTREDVLSSLKTLTMYQAFKERLGEVDEKTLNQILDRLLTEKNSQKNPFADKLSGIIDKALNGQVGYENRAPFENMARSILVNESVYMPLIYTLLPAELDGKQLFSEMWIDPDDGNRSQYGEEERVNRVYLRFNIRDLGNFDLVMNLQNQKVDLQLLCPDDLNEHFSKIRNDIGKIIENNSLKQNNIYIEKNTGNLSLTDVFPKIKEGRNNINVSV